jgi:hypothetical protein
MSSDVDGAAGHAPWGLDSWGEEQLATPPWGLASQAGVDLTDSIGYQFVSVSSNSTTVWMAKEWHSKMFKFPL